MGAGDVCPRTPGSPAKNKTPPRKMNQMVLGKLLEGQPRGLISIISARFLRGTGREGTPEPFAEITQERRWARRSSFINMTTTHQSALQLIVSEKSVWTLCRSPSSRVIGEVKF